MNTASSPSRAETEWSVQWSLAGSQKREEVILVSANSLVSALKLAEAQIKKLLLEREEKRRHRIISIDAVTSLPDPGTAASKAVQDSAPHSGGDVASPGEPSSAQAKSGGTRQSSKEAEHGHASPESA